MQIKHISLIMHLSINRIQIVQTNHILQRVTPHACIIILEISTNTNTMCQASQLALVLLNLLAYGWIASKDCMLPAVLCFVSLVAEKVLPFCCTIPHSSTAPKIPYQINNIHKQKNKQIRIGTNSLYALTYLSKKSIIGIRQSD